MTVPATMTDDAFLEAFAACRLSAAAFDHVGHIRIAWIHLQRQPLAAAIDDTCNSIERFAQHLGVPMKYNRTLSEALLQIMALRGATDRNRAWPDFLRANPDLVHDAQGLLARHYSPGRLNSPEARNRFVAPDRAPLSA